MTEPTFLPPDGKWTPLYQPRWWHRIVLWFCPTMIARDKNYELRYKFLNGRLYVVGSEWRREA